jgi:hypothetical protein
MSSSYRIASGEETDGLSLASLVSRLGASPGGPATFFASKDPQETAWATWQTGLFLPVIAPAFAELWHCAESGRVAELSAADAFLDAELPEPARQHGREAAAAYREGKTELLHHRPWFQFVERVREKRSPGQVASFFALHCALFHLPLSSSLLAYAWFEFQSGLPSANRGWQAENLMLFESIIPHLAVAVGGKRGQGSSESPFLRVV